MLCVHQQKKGHYLIALDSNCVNAFFIRSDLKNKFEIIDNIKSFKTPNKYSIDDITKAKEKLLNTKLHLFK